MISFLRKIRKSLIGTGATRKYLIYAIGEIALVMIGILLALQVNNWNEERLLQNQLDSQLNNLLEALDKDHHLLENIEVFNTYRYHSLHHFLELSDSLRFPFPKDSSFHYENVVIWKGPFPDTLDKTFVQNIFLWITRPRAMTPHSYAIEELKSTGMYSKLDDQQLKNLINEYYAQLEWRFGGDMDVVDPNLQVLKTYLRDEYNLLMSDMSALPDPKSFIMEDPALMIRFRAVIQTARWRKNSAAYCLEKGEEIMNMIKSRKAEK